MMFCRLGPPNFLVQPRQGEMGCIAGLQRQARLEIVLGFAPQPAMGTKPSKRQEERSIVRMPLEPSLCPFNLPDSVIRRIFSIKLGQFGIPLIIQALLNNLMSCRAITERCRCGRSGSSQFAVLFIGLRKYSANIPLVPEGLGFCF